VRDALSAVRNLAALLRSPNVASATLVDVVPELRESAQAMREEFERASQSIPVARDAATFGSTRVDELMSVLDSIGSSASLPERAAIEARVNQLSPELDGAAELLSLVQRAETHNATEVSLDRLVREVPQMAPNASSEVVKVRLDASTPDCVVSSDPHVLASLLALSVSRTHALEPGDVAVRVRCDPARGSVVVEPATVADAALPVLTIRPTPFLPVAEPIAASVATAVGATLAFEGPRTIFRLPVVRDEGG
jgi:hypothetical protein